MLVLFFWYISYLLVVNTINFGNYNDGTLGFLSIN